MVVSSHWLVALGVCSGKPEAMADSRNWEVVVGTSGNQRVAAVVSGECVIVLLFAATSRRCFHMRISSLGSPLYKITVLMILTVVTRVNGTWMRES